MRIMGLDYGTKTVGVAVSDPLGITAQAVETVVRKSEKISRNAPCPCGSGKKYKHCCGR